MGDVTELSLFDDVPEASQPAPRCPMCARPARWMARAREYAMYCAGRACSNRERICQSCGEGFHINVGGAGTKYCSTECKRAGYRCAESLPPPLCAWCGRSAPPGGTARRDGIWPYICIDCTSPISHLTTRLRSHHVSHERARQLLDDPGCEVCGRDMVTKARDPNTGRFRSLLAVDHDHDCCPGVRSCGLCVRGLLCMQCNAAAGLLGDEPERARSLALYVERFSRCPNAAS